MMTRSPATTRLFTLAAAALLLIAAGQAQAASVRAWLDRSQIQMGETVTLNVEAEGVDGEPDFSVIPHGLEVRGRSSSRQTRLVNGSASSSTLWAVALEPARTGRFDIPAIAVADQRSGPLVLTVSEPVSGSAAAGEPVFLEAELDSASPYVGQLVTYTLRLHYAVQLIEGALDAPPPEGGDLRQLGADRNFQAQRAGRAYTVVERRYALLPERSGELALPVARFRGRAIGSGSSFSWMGGQAVSAVGPELRVEVRPRPDGAKLPWLPAIAVEPALSAPPGPLRVGEPFSLQQSVRIVGVVSEQFSPPELPRIDGAQVYAEAPEFSESVRDGVPVLEWRRAIAVVPMTQGTLAVPAQSLDWWNIGEDRAAVARTPGLNLDIQPALAPASPSIAPGSPIAAGDDAMPGADRLPVGPGSWPWLSLLLAIGWAATLAWHRRSAWLAARYSRSDGAAAKPAIAASRRQLDRALAEGDLSAISHCLLALAPAPTPSGLSQLAARLRSPAQQQAVLALDAALWGGGDREQARSLLRAAFIQMPAFAESPDPDAVGDDIELPPLYPPRLRD